MGYGFSEVAALDGSSLLSRASETVDMFFITGISEASVIWKFPSAIAEISYTFSSKHTL